MKEATWEAKEDIKSKCLHLFSSPGIREEGMSSSTYFCFQTLLKERLISLHIYFLTWLKVGLIFDNANGSYLCLPYLVRYSGMNVPSGGD